MDESREDGSGACGWGAPRCSLSVCDHHVRSGLQILEVLLLDPGHHPVVVQVLLHLHVVWVGLEEGVGSCHRLVQLVDLGHQRKKVRFLTATLHR